MRHIDKPEYLIKNIYGRLIEDVELASGEVIPTGTVMLLEECYYTESGETDFHCLEFNGRKFSLTLEIMPEEFERIHQAGVA